VAGFFCLFSVIRGPWSFGRGFHVVKRSAAEGRAAAETITRRPWPVVWCRWRRFPARGALVFGAGGAGFLHVARGLVAPVFGCGHPNKARRRRRMACG